MNRIKSNQNRAVSANIGSQRKERLLSSKPQNKKYGRTYTQVNDVEHILKSNKSRLYTSGLQHISKSHQKHIKAPQQLLEQNINLKIQLNDINSQLYLTRSKIESQKRKNVYAKRLNREFQKQLYWSNEKGSEYLITGIKHQYQKLKQSFDQKCRQLQMVKQTISSTHIQEASAYYEALQVQNKILIQNITYLKKNKRKNSNINDHNRSESNFVNQDIENILFQQRKKQEKYKNKIKFLQEQLNKQNKNQKQLIKKIVFLQKKCIQKQNDAHHACRQVKIIQRQKIKLLKQLKIIESKISENEQKYMQDFEEFKEKNSRQTKAQNIVFEKILRQKTVMIEKLEKQISYLSTLLSYWKPLDELDRSDKMDQISSQKQKTLSNNQSLNLQAGQNRQIQRCKTPVNLMLSQQNEDRFTIRNSYHEETFMGKDSSFLTVNNESQDKTQTKLNRQPRRSTKKWSEDAKKCRKVQFSEVQYIGQLIRYKMIAYRKSLNEVKQYFSCKIQKSNSSKLQEQLITMKEIKQTFISEPFSLSLQQAYLLSRYIIEDSGTEYVYCHQGNQLERSIVKSIIKTIVGEYVVPDFEKTQEKWKLIKKVYSHNMQLALKSICPKGIITKDKFLQLINSLGIQTDDETKNYLIGRLIEKENSLKTLKYEILFSSDQKID